MKTKLFGFVASILLLAVLRLSAAAPVVLFTDNFTGTGTPDSNDLNYNLPGRQTGPLGLIGYTTDGNTQVGNPGEPHDGGNVLLCASAKAALLYNFNNSKSAGGLKISFDLDPNAHNNGDTSHWGAVVLGAGWAVATTSSWVGACISASSSGPTAAFRPLTAAPRSTAARRPGPTRGTTAFSFTVLIWSSPIPQTATRSTARAISRSKSLWTAASRRSSPGPSRTGITRTISSTCMRPTSPILTI